MKASIHSEVRFFTNWWRKSKPFEQGNEKQCGWMVCLETLELIYMSPSGLGNRPSDRHGYLWVPNDQGPRGPCQVDSNRQKPYRPASGPRDLIHAPGDLGRSRTTLSRSWATCQVCGGSLSLDHGGGAASRPKDREILFVIMGGDHPKICNRPRRGPTDLEWKP
jgi:hypothetical protein